MPLICFPFSFAVADAEDFSAATALCPSFRSFDCALASDEAFPFALAFTLSDLISDFPLTVAFVFTFVCAKEAVARNNAAENNNVVLNFFFFD